MTDLGNIWWKVSAGCSTVGPFFCPLLLYHPPHAVPSPHPHGLHSGEEAVQLIRYDLRSDACVRLYVLFDLSLTLWTTASG